MIKEIVKHPNPLLKQRSAYVSRIENIDGLIKDMFDSCEANNGVGLAAVQIGVLKRVLIISFEGTRKVIINPEIKKAGKKLVKETEGCLSYPGEKVMMERPRDIEVIYENELRDIERVRYSGFLARIIQHEMDHFEGTAII